MNIFGRIRQHKTVAAVISFQKTGWFSVALGGFAVLSCLLGFDIIAFYIFAAVAVFTLLVNDDFFCVLPVLVFPYFAASVGRGEGVLGAYGAYSLTEAVQIAACAGVAAVALVVRLAETGALKSIFTRKVALFGSMVWITAALLFGGLAVTFTGGAEAFFGNLLNGFILLLCFAGGYFVFVHALPNRHSGTERLMNTLSIMGLTIFIQLFITAIIAWANGKLLTDGTYFIHKTALTLGWGNADIVASLLLICLPAALWRTMKCGKPFFSYVLSLLFLGGIMLTQSRVAIYIGIAAILTGMILCCIKGKNKRFGRYFTAALIGIAMIILSFAADRTPALFNRMLALDQGWTAGADIATAWTFFASSPFLGVGTVVAGGLNIGLFSSVAAACGVLGIITLLYHCGQVAVICLRRLSAERMFITMTIGSLVLLSMFGNLLFYPPLAVLYSVILAFAERDFDYCREKTLAEHRPVRAAEDGFRPRVAFTYVEAGLGHIMSEKAVEHAFAKKYGDKTEIIHSDFFTETNSAELESMQRLFSVTVKIQNEIRGLGGFMMTVSAMGGDWLSHTATMLLPPPALRALHEAVRHIEELDADVLFTTHWSTAYYASLAHRRPFVVMMCPDVKINPMFRIDSNLLLMCDKVGYDDALCLRRFSPAKVKLVPRPIRAEAYEYAGKRDECRKALGIDKSAFVVLLADGGYGMSKMVEATRRLLDSSRKLTVIAVAGLSVEVRDKLLKFKAPPNIDYRPFGYTDDVLKMLAAADLFVGKSGACFSSETYFFGVPMIITNVATTIERDIMKHCRDDIGCAIYEPNVKKAVALVEQFADNPSALTPYAKNAVNRRENFGEEASADLIWEVLQRRGEAGAYYKDYGDVTPPRDPERPRTLLARIKYHFKTDEE